MKRTGLFLGIISFIAMLGFLLASCKEASASADSIVDIAAIQGVTVPVSGGTPVTAITENEQYYGAVAWNDSPSTFKASTVYTAKITLVPKIGYTLQGVTANFFTVAGAVATNAANSGVITAVFPVTASPKVIDIAAIQGLTVPAAGGTPVKSITENAQYSGTVTWSPNNSTFTVSTQYTATITLTAKTGYTLQGVKANFFTVAGAITVNNSANSGVITAVFQSTPGTAANPAKIDIAAIGGVTVPAAGGTPVTSITENAQYSGNVTWSPNHSVFAAATQYTATITLTAKTGYTLQGVAGNFFTVAGAASVGNSANSGVITAVFPATAGTGGSSTRSVTIDMYDSAGDGWDGGGALRINVNGVDIASNVKVQSGSTNQYTFNVTTGDVVRLYWVIGTYQAENSFIVYYTDTPPSPSFTTSNNNSWNGSNALVYKLRGTMNSTSGGTLLGSFTVENGNAGNNTVINIAAIQGVTVPVTGEIPVTAITDNEQYSGTVTWSPNHSAFAASTQYTATIRLTAKTGYTLQGVAANFFTVAGATSVSNSVNSGVITAAFPQTNFLTPDSRIEYYWVDQHGSLVTTSGGAVTVASGATLTITAQSTGYTARQWYLNGVNTGQSGNTYSFSSTAAGKHIVGLFVEKDGKLYNTNITITVGTAGNSGTETNPFPLTAGTWENGSITSSASGSAVWYSFNVTSGTTYRVWWNDSYQGNSTKSLDIMVSATYSNGTAIFTGVDSAYTSAQSFTANQTGTVKLKVYPYTSGGTGTFAVVYSTGSTRP